MLKSRIITALIVTLGLFALLYGLPVLAFEMIIACVFTLAAWEWAGLASIEKTWPRLFYAFIMHAVILCAGYFLGLFTQIDTDLFRGFMGLSCLFWAFALLWVKTFPGSTVFWSHPICIALMGFFVLAPSALALFYLVGLEHGKWLFLYLVGVVSLADTGAYFSGKRWGKHKLAPKVSPGKTWEGVLGGLFCGAVFAFIIGHLFSLFHLSAMALMLVSMITIAASVLGDLVESMVKRQAGKKDSSQLLPGHGGIMDRIDSQTAAAPVFVLLILLL